MDLDQSPKELLRRQFRRLLRWLFWALIAVVLVLAGAGVYFEVLHGKAVNRLAEATADLDAHHPGWRLADLEAARAKVADDENGALVVQATAKLLPKDWPPPTIEFSKQFGDWPPNKRLTSEQVNRLRTALEPLKEALAEARKLATRPTGRYPVVYERDPRVMQYPYLGDIRAVTELLILEALLQMEDGHWGDAATLCQAALNAGRSVGDEPLMLSQIVRSTCVQLAGKAVERLLAQGEPERNDLETLQRLLDDEAKQPGFLLSCRGERALLDSTLRAIEDGDLVLGGEQNRSLKWQERFWTFAKRDELRLEHAAVLPLLNKLVDIAKLPPAERAEPLFEFRTLFDPQPKNLATMSLPALEICATSFQRRAAYLGCLSSALASERYRRSHTDWPPSLAALTPDFLASVPLDVVDGQPLSYARLSDGIAIYSRTQDAKGNYFDPEKPSLPAAGIAVRLWNVGQRRKGD
jgi:hypothetical protein